MNYRKRNGFLVFCFSFIPGAVEMYMGFMKNGVSLMAVFVAAFSLAMYGWYFTTIFLGIAVVTWFYGFFHAWNLYRLSADILVKKDDKFIWTEFGFEEKINIKMEDEKKRRIIAIGVVVLGVILLYNSFADAIYSIPGGEYIGIRHFIKYDFPKIFFEVCMILGGLKFIKIKKDELDTDIDAVNDCTDENKEVYNDLNDGEERDAGLDKGNREEDDNKAEDSADCAVNSEKEITEEKDLIGD